VTAAARAGTKFGVTPGPPGGNVASVMRVILPLGLASLLICTLTYPVSAAGPPPDDFPRFQAPGFEKEMETLRALFWLHYPGAGPKATLWDEWLSGPGLWPAVGTEGMADGFRRQWSEVLSARVIEPEGYVATHQHGSIAHQHGWPFPFWAQGKGGAGWHFSFKDTIGPPWRPKDLDTPAEWSLQNARDAGVTEEGWKLELTAARATATAPARSIDTLQAPFLQLRWSATGLDRAEPFVEWTSADAPDTFAPERRVLFEPVQGTGMTYAMIPMYKHPLWTGETRRLRVNFDNPAAGATVVLQALFTQYDTRHNINSQNFIRGCATYFWWTRDVAFLRRNINRMRTALRYLMTEHQTLGRKVVFTDWVGHDGLTGLERRPDGSKQIRSGHGIGNNYWDLLPFGHLDAYATVHYYDALGAMVRIESEIADTPEWQIPQGALAFSPTMLAEHAAEVKTEGNRLFWNSRTGRFVACVDAEGATHDYGFTFLNLEAVHYGFATPEHSEQILSWVSGARRVEGDTAQGADIYHWRFGPRSTTLRNIDWYLWAWSGPESIPWGGQVQDGGAVLGFSYHDLMARLKTRGPDDAWKRLQEILRWFEEVQAAGGYRKYYDGKREGTLQGGGTAGGLGLDQEFFESVMVPQVILNGFLGFVPSGDGFRLEPRLPSAWPSLTVSRIRFHDAVLRIMVSPAAIEITAEGRIERPVFVGLPAGAWKAAWLKADGSPGANVELKPRPADITYRLDWADAATIRFSR
jgi:hypothetical protein